LKILALVIIVILLFHRIKNTPSMLSKKLYEKKMKKLLESQARNFKIIDDEEKIDTYKAIIIWCAFLLIVFLIIFYAILGTKIGTTEFIIMSVLEILTCFYSLKSIFDKNTFSQNIEDYKFHRFFFLFNAALDYVYYVSAIYVLLK
jgi:hypothetical protein